MKHLECMFCSIKTHIYTLYVPTSYSNMSVLPWRFLHHEIIRHVYLLEFGININILIWALSLGPGIFDISKKVHAGVHVIYKTWKQHMEMNVAFLWSVF